MSAEGLTRCSLALHRGPEGQHLTTSAWTEGDAVRDGHRLQRPQRACLVPIGIRLGRMALPHLLDQRAPARKKPHQSHDGLT